MVPASKPAEHIVVLTGAGVSKDSGVPTFRDADGLWEGHSSEDVATPEGWERDPALVWRFYQQRRRDLATVEPNAAHVALARLERVLGERGIPFLLVSQNVDDLHRRAGSENLIDMHGQLRWLRCEACGVRVWNETDVDPTVFLPCAACGHPRLRPDVVWFGEVPYVLAEIERAVFRCTRFLCLGTSGAVFPAASYLALARAAGARCVVQALERPLNVPEARAVPGGDPPWVTFLPGRAAEVVPVLVEDWLRELAP